MTVGQHTVLRNASSIVAKLDGLRARIVTLRCECEHALAALHSSADWNRALFDELSLLVGAAHEMLTKEFDTESKHQYIELGQSSILS
jgi:hypothetical protein